LLDSADVDFAASIGEALKPLERADVDSIDRPVRIVNDESATEDARESACWLVTRIDLDRERVAITLMTALEDPVWRMRSQAAIELGRLGVKKARPALIRHLRSDSEMWVRFMSAGALGSLGGTRAAAALIHALNDQSESPDVRDMAADALGEMGSARALPALLSHLGDRSEKVRRSCAFALGALGDPSAIPELKKALAGTNKDDPRQLSFRDEVRDAIVQIRRRAQQLGTDSH